MRTFKEFLNEGSNLTIDDLRKASNLDSGVRCPSLDKMKKFIEDNMGDKYDVELRDSRVDTARKSATGKRLVVYNKGKQSVPVFDHDTTQTYAKNIYACRWIVKEYDRLKK